MIAWTWCLMELRQKQQSEIQKRSRMEFCMDQVKYFSGLIGEQAVLIPIAFGKKQPIQKGWNEIGWEVTQAEEYQRRLREGNLGVRMGDGLVAIDIDNDADVEPFLDRNPWAKETLMTKGRRGCQIFFRIADEFPQKKMILKGTPAAPSIEFRAGCGCQSVIYGQHPDGMMYQVLVERMVKVIRWADISDYIDECLMRVDTVSNREKLRQYDWTREEAYRKVTFETLDLKGLMRELGIETRGTSDPRKWALKCPWIREHTSGMGMLDATIWQWPNAEYWPSFKCFHAHCENKGLRELLEWAEYRVPGITEKYTGKIKGKDSGAKRALPEIIMVKTCHEYKIDTDNNLLGDRWLCRGGSMFIIAPSGIGKSVMVMQAAIEWALGKPAFGIKPNGKPRSLIIECEDDMGDLKEHTSIMTTFTEEEKEEVGDKVGIVKDLIGCGWEDFMDIFPRLLEMFRPDIVWINPYSAYSPPILDDEKNIRFLGSLIKNAIDYNCGLFCVHHVPKAVIRNAEMRTMSAYAYAGAGSAVMTTIPRGNMIIDYVQGSRIIFKFCAAKRGAKIGWEGETERYFQHSEVPGKYYWLPVDEKDVEEMQKMAEEEKPKSKTVTADDLLKLLKEYPKGLQMEFAMERLGISERTFMRRIAELKEERKAVGKKLGVNTIYWAV